MSTAKNIRMTRLPLRDLLNQAEHRSRELTQHLQLDLTPAVTDFHKIVRPQRKNSPFPSVRSILNVYDRMRKSIAYADKLSEGIVECVEIIEQRADDSL